MKHLMILLTCTALLAACGKQADTKATDNTNSAPLSAACQAYFDKTEKMLEQTGQASEQMKTMMDKNIAEMKTQWRNMTSEEQAQMDKSCSVMMEKFDEMMKQIESMPNQ